MVPLYFLSFFSVPPTSKPLSKKRKKQHENSIRLENRLKTRNSSLCIFEPSLSKALLFQAVTEAAATSCRGKSPASKP